MPMVPNPNPNPNPPNNDPGYELSVRYGWGGYWPHGVVTLTKYDAEGEAHIEKTIGWTSDDTHPNGRFFGNGVSGILDLNDFLSYEFYSDSRGITDKEAENFLDSIEKSSDTPLSYAVVGDNNNGTIGRVNCFEFANNVFNHNYHDGPINLFLPHTISDWDNQFDRWGSDPHGPHPPIDDTDPAFFPVSYSPLILDLDGDGVEADGLAYFDHEGDGFTELSAWAGVDDGTLVWDRNSDGVINDGSELFGNNTVLASGNKAAHGFAALADLDSNGDGVIDSSDTEWAELKVMHWTDGDGDGVKDTLELSGLADLDIESLNTTYIDSDHVDEVGNEHRQVGSFTKTNGTTETMTDVWFRSNKGITFYDTDSLPTQSDTIQALPELAGSGRVYNLRDAMALDDETGADGNSLLTAPYYSNDRTETRSLREMVEAFVEVNTDGAPNLDKTAREALAEKILLRWAGAEGATGYDYWNRSKISHTTADKVAVVEAFQGEQWRKGQNNRNPAYSTAQKVERGYLNHLESLYGSLMFQTHLKDLHDEVAIALKPNAAEDTRDFNDYELNFTDAKAILDSENNTRLGEFLRSLAAVYGANDWVAAGMTSTAADWAYEYEYLAGAVRDGISDQLYGYGGDDTYWLGYGTGHDTINEYESNSGDANDVIKLAPDIVASQVSLSRNSNDLVVQLLDSNGSVSDSLTVVNYYTDDSAKIERVEFDDGTVWGADDFTPAQVWIRSGSDNDTLRGLDNYNDIFDSDAGGNDRLYGYGGDDTYWLGYGTGHDTIREYDSNIGDANDVIKLKEGIGTNDVQLVRYGSSLFVRLLTSDGSVSDSLTVVNYYTDDSAKIERVEFDDGTVWGADDFALAQVWIIGGSDNDTLYGLDNSNDVFDSDAGGDDRLHGYGGDDTYWLGYGTDHDTIREYYDNSGDANDVIKLKGGIETNDVRLSRNSVNLVVQLLDSNGLVSDSLTVVNYYWDDSAKIERVKFVDDTVLWSANDFALAQVWIRGGSDNDTLNGLDNSNDVFDSDAGGNDRLHGQSGDDTYWLGYGTDFDIIREYYSNIGDANDVIKLKEGIGTEDVQMVHGDDGNDLVVQLLANDGSVSDSLTVVNYYTDDSAKIERVEFADGTVWGADDIDYYFAIRGTSAYENLYGLDNYNDVFDADAGGNDRLYGYGGDDTYWLGYGTGRDTIREYNSNSGDANDVIKLEEGIGTEDVQLMRYSSNLFVQLLASDGSVSDFLKVENYYTDDSAKIEQVEFVDGTVWGADDFVQVRIRGGSGNDWLYGLDYYNDVFDADAGGNDRLYGYGGDDTYWLGYGTDFDIIREYYSNIGDANDVIKLKEGIGTEDVQMVRNSYGDDLVVQLLASDGSVSDSLTVGYYYTDDSAKIERVEFADGTAWDADDFAQVRIRGGSGNDTLRGLDNYNDTFDSDAGGNDQLYGKGGNDTYWLGYGTGHDTINEYDSNSGDAGDVIKLKEGIGREDVQIMRNKDSNSLVVQLLASNGSVSDSLTVENYYTDDSANIEQVEFADSTVLWSANDFALAQVWVRGGSGNDDLYGLDNYNDVFDSDAGGNDNLRGGSGNDVYWLGAGTDNDVIQEYYYNLGDDGDVIKIEEGFGTDNILLERSSNGLDLIVKLVDDAGVETDDSLTVQFHFADPSASYYKNYMQGSAIESIEFADGTVWSTDDIDYYFSAIRGTSSDENLDGEKDVTDVFDADAGGNDKLRGRSGNDVYWLGAGTDNDVIQEYYYNLGDDGDAIKIESSYGINNVRLERNDTNLIVKLVDDAGVETDDSLTVKLHFADSSASYYKNYMQGSAIESIEFADGTVWSTDDIDYYFSAIRGTSSDENLDGEKDVTDVFDADAGGSDNLRGRSGNDVYWLGAGTDNDVIEEYYYNLGDDGDVIKIEEGFGTDNILLERSSNGLDLIVKLVDDAGVETDDSLTVKLHFADSSAGYYKNYMKGSAVEQIEADGKVLLSSQYTALINEIAAFENGTSTSGYASTAEIMSDFWNDISTISNPT